MQTLTGATLRTAEITVAEARVSETLSQTRLTTVYENKTVDER